MRARVLREVHHHEPAFVFEPQGFALEPPAIKRDLDHLPASRKLLDRVRHPQDGGVTRERLADRHLDRAIVCDSDTDHCGLRPAAADIDRARVARLPRSRSRPDMPTNTRPAATRLHRLRKPSSAVAQKPQALPAGVARPMPPVKAIHALALSMLEDEPEGRRDYQALASLARQKQPTGRSLTDKTVRNVIGTLRTCLATAVREGLIRHNAARDVALPHRPKIEEDDEQVRVFTRVQLASFLE
jgi:hypothetical protein